MPIGGPSKKAARGGQVSIRMHSDNPFSSLPGTISRKPLRADVGTHSPRAARLVATTQIRDRIFELLDKALAGSSNSLKGTLCLGVE